MHGLVVGAILGVGAIAFVGAYRSVNNWKTSSRRPPAWVIAIQVGLQIALGITAAMFAIYFMLFGE
jgi:phosphate/sulfate permease